MSKMHSPELFEESKETSLSINHNSKITIVLPCSPLSLLFTPNSKEQVKGSKMKKGERGWMKVFDRKIGKREAT